MGNKTTPNLTDFPPDNLHPANRKSNYNNKNDKNLRDHLHNYQMLYQNFGTTVTIDLQ